MPALATRLLHLLPPETAHAAALRLVGMVPWPSLKPDPRLAVSLAGLALPHPLGLAAGLDKSAAAFAGLQRLGFAFVETGTFTPLPQAGNPRPRLFRLSEDRAIVNRMGFNNEGLEAAAARLAARRQEAGVLGANIGMNKDAPDAAQAYATGLRRVAPLVDYVTINISSPNTPGLRALQKAEALEGLLAALIACRDGLARRVPLFLKLAPDLDPEEIAAIAAIALRHAVDALIVSNTTIARPATLRSAHAKEAGGLSGLPLRERSDAVLRSFALALGGKVPLIGVGGVDSAESAYAKIRSGATAVQVYTGLIYRGPGLVREIVSGLPRLLERDGLPNIAAAVGADL